jgi:hypothetical protein
MTPVGLINGVAKLINMAIVVIEKAIGLAIVEIGVMQTAVPPPPFPAAPCTTTKVVIVVAVVVIIRRVKAPATSPPEVSMTAPGVELVAHGEGSMVIFESVTAAGDVGVVYEAVTAVAGERAVVACKRPQLLDGLVVDVPADPAAPVSCAANLAFRLESIDDGYEAPMVAFEDKIATIDAPGVPVVFKSV